MATLRVGTATPTSLRMGTVTVTAAYMGTVAVWPLAGGFAGYISASSNRATATINGTHAVSANFIGTITASSNRAVAVISVTFTPVANIFYRTFNGTTDALAVNIGNLAGANSVPETWIVACRITVPVAADGEIVHGVSTAAGATPAGYDPVDLYLTTVAGGKWHFFNGLVDFPNGPDATALDTIICVRRGTGTNVRWSVATHNGTTWSGFVHGDEAVPSTNRPYAATGVMEFASNPAIASRLAAVARYSTALTDTQINTQLTSNLAEWAAIPTITNLWRFDQTPVADTVGTATQNTLVGTTVPGTFPLDAVPIGGPTPVTGVLTASSNRQTGTLAGTYTPAPTTSVLTGIANRQTAAISATLAGAPSQATISASSNRATAVINVTFAAAPTGTITASSNRATAVINATFAAPPVTSVLTGPANRATATINATFTAAPSGPPKYRTFNGSTDSLTWTLGNLSGASSNPQTLVAVVRLNAISPDQEMFYAPGYDPVDWYYHNSGADKIAYYDGANAVDGPAWGTSVWVLWAIRTVNGAAGKWSQSTYNGTTWPTPTHTAAGITFGNRAWGTSGVITMCHDPGMSCDLVLIARFNTDLTDAAINNMINGVAAIQATSGITNLWLVGQTTPADLVGTSALSALTGTTLSSGASPFPG